MKQRQFMNLENPAPSSRLRFQIFMCWLLLVGLLHAAPQPNTKDVRLITKETSSGKVPLMADLERLVVSPDNNHIAFPVMRAGQWSIWRDGNESGRFQLVKDLSFSPDGKRLAYIGTHRVEWREGSRRNTTERTFVGIDILSKEAVVVVDGKEGPEYDGVDFPASPFSPDSRRLAYVAQRRDKQLAVVDGKEGPEFDFIAAGHPVFSANSERFAYVATNAGNYLVVVDGKESKRYDDVYANHCFSPDSRHVAYSATLGNKTMVVVDGKEGPALNVSGDVVFSPNSQRIAYVAKRGSKQFIVIDGKEGKEYDGADNATFSPDSQKVAYSAYTKAGDTSGRQGMVVVDGKAGPVFEGIGDEPITFSPDSQRMAYSAFRRGKWVVVSDGKEGPEFEAISGPLLFSPDSKRLAYVVKRGSKWQVIVNEQAGIEYDGIGKRHPVFSRDSRHFAYMAWRGSKSLVVVDGVESREYERAKPMVFDGSNRIRFVATCDDELFNRIIVRVEIEIVEEQRPAQVPGEKK